MNLSGGRQVSQLMRAYPVIPFIHQTECKENAIKNFWFLRKNTLYDRRYRKPSIKLFNEIDILENRCVYPEW